MTRTTSIAIGLVVIGANLLAAQALLAEEFRVFTVIHDASAATAEKPGPVIARTVTIFHAGKVYDYIESAGGSEVIIFEPTQRRFRILNLTQGMVTTAAFDEIKQKLKVAREETAREARVLSATNPGRATVAEMLTFQLSPQFKTSFDEKTLSLALKAEPITYQVETVRPEHPEIVDIYLDYADWVCRLNYVLSIGQVLPEPRLALNRQLRERNVLPESVVLTAQTIPATHMRAEHTFHLDLKENERGWIHQWETQLNSETIRKVTLQQYQEEVLTARTQ